MVTVVGFKLHVGMSFTLLIVVVTLHVKFTVPLNPFVPATEIVSVFPVVEPGDTVIEVVPPEPVVKLGAELTVTFTTVVCVMLPLWAVTVMAYAPVVVVVVEFAVSVAVCTPAPVMTTDDGMLQVTGLVALAGAVVTAQLRVTVPVNPLDGVAVIVDISPVVTPWATVMAPLLEMEKVGVAVTVIGAVDVPDALL
jgi:hypothetical protein